MPLPSVVNTVVDFLRAGYPTGVPEQDYVPLFALLRRRLTDEEVGQVADVLIADGCVASGQALHDAISGVTRDEPRAEDVARVRAHLAEAGWPLANPDEFGGQSPVEPAAAETR
jgi:hypothetical protein